MLVSNNMVKHIFVMFACTTFGMPKNCMGS
jgi:hypothetical protein